MKYIVRVMTMGDMSPAGLSHAFYNSPTGEPDDILVDTLGVYDSLEEANKNASDDYDTFEREYGEDSGCWIECIQVEDDDYLDYVEETDTLEFLSSDELYDMYAPQEGEW